MDNPEKLTTLGMQDTGRRQTKQKTQRIKLKKMTNTDLTKNRNEPRCWRRVSSSCFL